LFGIYGSLNYIRDLCIDFLGYLILSHLILGLLIKTILITAALGHTTFQALPLPEVFDPELFLRIFLQLLSNFFAPKD
jgi:hypothetical protein